MGPELCKTGGWLGEGFLAQEMPGPQQGRERRGGIDRRGGVGFAELAPGAVDHQGQMRIGRNREPEGLEQSYLTWCRGQQVGPADNLIDPLKPIIHDHGELISMDAVRTTQNKVAHLARQVLAQCPLAPIADQDGSALGAEA